MSDGSRREADAREVYADIIDHAHYEPKRHRRMTLYNRAAQFAAFDALTGFSDMITEEARVTDGQIELSDGALEQLDRKLALIAEAVGRGERPAVTVRHFVPDRLKDGGSYEETSGEVKRIDPVERKLVFYGPGGNAPDPKLDLGLILDLRGEIWNNTKRR